MEILVWIRSPGEAETSVRLVATADFHAGTDGTCLVRLADPQAAPQHARFDLPTRWYTDKLVVVPVEDMQIDGVPTTWPTEITGENTLVIGRTELRFELEMPKPLSKWDPRSWFTNPSPFGPTVNPPPPRYHPLPPPTPPATRLPTGDPHEATLLAGLADDATRMVYADWLEERGLVEHAQFVRSPEMSVASPGGRLVAATTSGGWRATVCDAPIAECTHGGCSTPWAGLEKLGDPVRRRCGLCAREVAYGHDRATIGAAGRAHQPYARDFAVDEKLARQWYRHRCRWCEADNPFGAQVCHRCGAPLEPR